MEKYTVFYKNKENDNIINIDFSIEKITKNMSEISKKQTKDEIKKLIRNNLYEYYVNDMLIKYNKSKLKELYDINHDDDWEITTNKILSTDTLSYKVLKIEKVPMCDGCRYDMMGQRDHMDIGGCLNN